MHEWSWSKPKCGYPERTPRNRGNTQKVENTTPPHEIQYKKKRDHTAERLAERQHIPQISRNPFLELLNTCEGEGHVQMYIHDLSQQDEYLRPKDSNDSNLTQYK